MKLRSELVISFLRATDHHLNNNQWTLEEKQNESISNDHKLYRHNFFNKLKQLLNMFPAKPWLQKMYWKMQISEFVWFSIPVSQVLYHTKLTFQLVWLDLSCVQWIAIFVKSQNPLLICEVGFEVKQITPRLSRHLVEEHFWMAVFNLIQGRISAWRGGKFLMRH